VVGYDKGFLEDEERITGLFRERARPALSPLLYKFQLKVRNNVSRWKRPAFLWVI
jgi:hypothetical protein